MANNDADDRGGRAPAPQLQTMYTLRSHKLHRFSGNEADAEDSIREATLYFQLQPMEDPVAAVWLLGALEGCAKQEILSI